MLKNDRWSALSMKDKADLIKLMVENGVSSIDEMKSIYNSNIDRAVNATEHNFVQRLKDYPNTPKLDNGDGTFSTHSMSSGEVNGKSIVYPTVQIDESGKLRRYSENNFEAMDRAIRTNDTLQMHPAIAPWYAENYKQFYNIFDNGGGIHIKPENKGKFTALKERTGHSTSWFREHGTPAQKKMAVFATNAKKWNHHPDGGDLDTLSHPKYNSNAEAAIFNYLSNSGLNNAQAAGIMGNLAVESLLNSNINQFNGPAYGLIQAEGARKKALKAYHGNPYVFGSGLLPEEQKQLDYIIDVGINNYTPGEWGKQGYSGARAARKAFIDSSDVNEASDIFMRNYLRPGKPHQERRRKMSNYYFDKYGHNDFIFDAGEWALQNILKK